MNQPSTQHPTMPLSPSTEANATMPPSPDGGDAFRQSGGSLWAWVSQQMPATQRVALPQTLAPVPSPTLLTSQPWQSGQRLNGLDCDLNEALEPLLPTPTIRYGVMKQRLEQQKLELTRRLEQIRTALPDATHRATFTAPLEKRLRLMERQEGIVDSQWRYLLSRQAPFIRWGSVVLSQLQAVQQGVSRWVAQTEQWTQRVTDKTSDKSRQLAQSRQAVAISALLKRLEEGQPVVGGAADEQLRTRLINQYETLASQLKARGV